jgi:hypothetical protein
LGNREVRRRRAAAEQPKLERQAGIPLVAFAGCRATIDALQRTVFAQTDSESN